jgi:predicted ATPase
MLDIIEVNERIYSFLQEKRRYDSQLVYTFRKSNLSNRLEEGYWFYGNETYLAISFWTGMDWKNRTPNIVYIITNLGESFLEINVSDSDKKRAFVDKYLIQEIELTPHGRKYVKRYSNDYNSYLDFFDRFLNEDKRKIDYLIERFSTDFFRESPGENTISFIPLNEFQSRHLKIKRYQNTKKQLEEEDDFFLYEDRPSKLLSLVLNNYGLIENINLQIGSKKNQWIFITGENGSGKTCLLRAIGTVLGHRLLSQNELNENPNFYASAELLFKNEVLKFERQANSEAYGKKRPLIEGLAMYGPYRLDTSLNKLSKASLKKEFHKEESFKSLLKTGAQLLSIDNQFNLWKKDKNRELFEKRKYFIISVLTSIVPNLVNINFQEDVQSSPTEYIFRDQINFETYTSTWDDLPSGIKSTIAMIGDILIRLYDQQRTINDPSEFRGIVLIDEIDLHLHPQAQKDIIINLTNTLPNIQFIVTTHSPIPLLGANENSIFYRVKRSFNKLTIERLFHIEKYIGELMPDHLLTSDLFGLDSLTSIRNKEKINVFTGSTMYNFNQFKELKDRNNLIDPDNIAFLKKFKSRLNEKNK